LIPKFGADEEGRGGIDFKLVVVNREEQIYTFLIECKYWANYNITPDIFQTQILDRFKFLDENREYHWIVTMNSRNIRYIENPCGQNNIHIFPLSEQITCEYVDEINNIKRVFGEVIDAFCSYITDIAPERAYPYMKFEYQGQNRYEGVIRDLFMGVSYDIIERRYNVAKGYISKLASYVRSFNISLPDRRRKDWRQIWEIQE
jgi:hypothetical protein